MSYLSPLLAVVTGIVHAGLASVIVIGGVKPNLVLVAVVLVTCLAGFLPGGLVWIYPIVAAFIGSIIADLLAFLIARLVADAAPSPPPFEMILAAAALNAAIVGLLLLPARALASRYLPEDAPAW